MIIYKNKQKKLEKAISIVLNFLEETTGEKPNDNINIETKLPVFNIEVKDNSKLKEEFEKYDN